MGEIQVRGPWITGSYYDLPGAGEISPRTAGCAPATSPTIDPLGFIKITDRTKDLIKSGGEWISSVDLENAIMGHPGRAEAAVIAVPHPKWAERPLAVIVFKPGAQATEADELKQFLAGKFVKWIVPDAYVFVGCDPAHVHGKVSQDPAARAVSGLEVGDGCEGPFASERHARRALAMDFQMTEERRLIQNLAREFARNEIAPIAAACDQAPRFPLELYRKRATSGW